MTAEQPAPSKKKKNSLGSLFRFLILAILLGVGTFFGLRALQKTEPAGAQAGPGGPPQGPPPSAVKVSTVQLIESQNTHRVIGTIRAVSRADVAAREEGALTEILVDEGQAVAKNDILARLDPRRLEAQMAQAQANLTVARSLIAQRKAETERNETDFEIKKELFASKAISESEYLDAERQSKVSLSQQKAAEDSLTAAAAALKLLDVRKDDLVIRAPFEARVVTRHAELGEWMRPGDPAFTLISAGQVEAWLQVPERFAGSVVAKDIEVEIGGQLYPATNLRPVPEADGATRVLTVIADIADPGNKLVPGLSAAADLPVSKRIQRLAVPSDALVTTYAGRALFRAQPKNDGPPTAEQLPVTFIYQEDGLAFIECEALKPGDMVITDGNERLRNGASLLIAESSKTTANR